MLNDSSCFSTKNSPGEMLTLAELLVLAALSCTLALMK